MLLEHNIIYYAVCLIIWSEIPRASNMISTLTKNTQLLDTLCVNKLRII